MKIRNKSGAKNVYVSGDKYYAQVTKNGKVHRSEPMSFEKAKQVASELRKMLNV